MPLTQCSFTNSPSLKSVRFPSMFVVQPQKPKRPKPRKPCKADLFARKPRSPTSPTSPIAISHRSEPWVPLDASSDSTGCHPADEPTSRGTAEDPIKGPELLGRQLRNLYLEPQALGVPDQDDYQTTKPWPLRKLRFNRAQLEF